MGCTPEEQAKYDAFFGDAPNVVSTITVDVSQMISVGGRGAGKTCAAHESHEPYEALKVKEGMYKEFAKGYKPIDLEDIMHIRGSVPHFIGHPVPTWEDVDRIENECRKLSNVAGISFDRACNIAADMFSKAVPDQYSPNKIKVVLKELANEVQFAKEKTIFNCRISARQARRSAQGVKFAKQLKNNFNVKKGK